jgi:hypothetical protein
MKTLFLSALLLCPMAGFAQQDMYEKSLNGCWQNSTNVHDLFILNSDFTCMRIKPGATDTLYGKWAVRTVYSIPFKSNVIVMTYRRSGKDRMEIRWAGRAAWQLTDFRHGKQRYTRCRL